MKDIYDIVRERLRHPEESFALATLVRARGSSYRRPGARMLIGRDQCTIGSLSGGCLEEEVAERAQEIFSTGRACLTSFDTRLRFGCNGAIDIFIEPLADDFIAALHTHLQARAKCFARTTFAGATENLGSRVAAFEENYDDSQSFLQEIHPQPRLLLFGSGPDSRPLRAFAEILGWQVIEAEHESEFPEEVDRWTAAIVKSHNYGRDFAALQKLLPLPLRYVGLIGPRRRRDQLLADVFESGTVAHAGLFAPTGLDLGSETPEEIALAIIAEIQHAFAGGTCSSLREIKAPIHVAPPRVEFSVAR